MLDKMKIAKICHEAIRAYCQLIGDYSIPSWCEASEENKKYAIDRVENFIAGKMELYKPDNKISAEEAIKSRIAFGIISNLAPLIEV